MIVQAYLTKQHQHYRLAMARGNQESAHDALWRAACTGQDAQREWSKAK